MSRRLMEIMANQKGPIKGQVDLVQRLTVEQRQRLEELRDGLAKVPDVSSEQARLEEIMRQWAEARKRVRIPREFLVLIA